MTDTNATALRCVLCFGNIGTNSNHKGHPFDSLRSLRAGYGTQKRLQAYANRALIAEVHANLGMAWDDIAQLYANLG